MQEILKQALDFSNYRYTLAIQRKLLKENIDSKLTFGYNGGIFKINLELMTFVQMLLDQDRRSGIVLLDVNENPILIDDLEKFKTEIFDRYFSITFEYYESYEKIKKSRSIEKLSDI